MAYRWNPEPLTCRVYIMRKGLQRGVSQRHRVVMTCQTIIHYHQLEIQQWIATANFGSPKAPLFAPKVIMWRSSQKNFIGRGHCPLPRSAPSPDPSPSEEEDTLPHTPFPSAPTGPRGPRLLRLQRSTSICSTPPSLFTPPSLHFLEICLGIHSLHSCIAYNSRLYGITYSVLIVGLRLIIHICKCYIDVL